MVAPSDSNFRVHQQEGERVSGDGEIIPVPSRPVKDFKKILDNRSRDSKASNKEDEDNFIVDDAAELGDSSDDLIVGASLSPYSEKITPLSHAGKKIQSSYNQLATKSEGSLELEYPESVLESPESLPNTDLGDQLSPITSSITPLTPYAKDLLKKVNVNLAAEVNETIALSTPTAPLQQAPSTKASGSIATNASKIKVEATYDDVLLDDGLSGVVKDVVQPEVGQPSIVKPGVVLPDAVKPGVVLPDAVKPGVILPDAVKPGVVLSDAVKPGVVLPDAVKPGVVLPDAVKPGVVLPDAIKPGVVLPDAVKPGVVLPDAVKPGVVLPDAVKPGVVLPDAVKPGVVLPNPSQGVAEEVQDTLLPYAVPKSTSKSSAATEKEGVAELDETVLPAVPQAIAQPLNKSRKTPYSLPLKTQDALQPETEEEVQVPIQVPIEEKAAQTTKKPEISLPTETTPKKIDASSQEGKLKSESKASVSDAPYLIPSKDLNKRAGETPSVESPFALFAAHGRAAIRDSAKSAPQGESNFLTREPPPPPLAAPHRDTGIARKDRVSSLFTEDEEPPDLASLNPIGTPLPILSNAGVKESPKPVLLTTEEINSIVDQIEKLYTVSARGQTDTIIVLKHPPLFEGAHVVIKSTATAPHEFNLSFENLRQAAQKVLDNNANQARLTAALDDKGYAVHIITTTTLIETYPIKTSESHTGKSYDQGASGDDRRQPGGQQNKKKQQ